LPKSDRTHFQRCRECGEWFDRRNLDEVAFHGFGHKQRSDIGYSSVRELRRCADCGGTMDFHRRRRKELVGYWKCEDCDRIEWGTPKQQTWTAKDITFSVRSEHGSES
jgi:hypothetical protein